MTTVQYRPSVSARLTGLLVLCGALALAALMVLPAPAQAHDSLLESDPADGASLETSPEALTFTFSGDILEVSPLVRISDADGEQVAEIVPTVDGPVVTAELPEPLPAGTFTVQWRVVSSDGHPIEGTFELTVEQDPAGDAAAEEDGDEQAAPAASDAGGAEESSGGAEESAPAQDQADDAADRAAAAESEEGGLGMPVLLGILAVIVIGVAAAVFAIVRRRD